ncbi:signal peptidase I [Fictibacillus sp. WQ 8-8]|uniref:Signal peptidase I n=2 Tax=Fictibacillaceae TaxID=3120697 RepID=A0A9X1X760_9BACL|nr:MULTISPECIES: signal peptidase I [unclassified Fictibacillus]MCK6255272.1 signal peptidase I [Fictibacillus marinisediminis]MCQ6268320.1 signal peptidase I [Fictibacillus sp. WQ 8-8]MED2972256.1 signal peptidase I [Fictibacillus sp. B-59209]UZJ81224.1 signal peptidase I [Fictibacillus sp. KU28468]
MMEQKAKKGNELFSWIKSIVFALVLVYIIKTFFFAPYMVEGASMSPTLHNHDKLYVNKIIYSVSEPKIGDIVIIKGTDKRYVKRVIGVEGDTIQVHSDKLLVNGKPIKEPYLSKNKKQARSLGVYLTEDFGPIKIPKGKIFVMGDNRLNSMDSRNGLGLINISSVEGRSEVVIYPFKDIRQTK